MMSETILRLPAVMRRTGLSRSAIYARLRAETFPAPIALGPRTRGWMSEDIADWIAAQRVTARTRRPAAH